MTYNLGGSLGRVSEEKFWSMTPKVGEWFKYRDGIFLKCTRPKRYDMRFTVLRIYHDKKNKIKRLSIEEDIRYPSIDTVRNIHNFVFTKVPSELMEDICSIFNKIG